MMYLCVFAQTPSSGFNAHILAHQYSLSNPKGTLCDIFHEVSSLLICSATIGSWVLWKNFFYGCCYLLCNTVILQLVILKLLTLFCLLFASQLWTASSYAIFFSWRTKVLSVPRWYKMRLEKLQNRIVINDSTWKDCLLMLCPDHPLLQPTRSFTLPFFPSQSMRSSLLFCFFHIWLVSN